MKNLFTLIKNEIVGMNCISNPNPGENHTCYGLYNRAVDWYVNECEGDVYDYTISEQAKLAAKRLTIVLDGTPKNPVNQTAIVWSLHKDDLADIFLLANKSNYGKMVIRALNHAIDASYHINPYTTEELLDRWDYTFNVVFDTLSLNTKPTLSNPSSIDEFYVRIGGFDKLVWVLKRIISFCCGSKDVTEFKGFGDCITCRFCKISGNTRICTKSAVVVDKDKYDIQQLAVYYKDLHFNSGELHSRYIKENVYLCKEHMFN